MYKYETHLHTKPVSRCGQTTVVENLDFYKQAGYDGVFVTNHFIDGSFGYDPDASYEEKIEFYFSDYEHAVEYGKTIDLKVFPGVEAGFGGTHFLIYGLDKKWFLENPQIMEMKESERLTLFMESGALIIQAHPFREAKFIDHIRLFPRHVHGVEIINGNREDYENGMSKLYAEHYELIEFAGTDNHIAGNTKRLAGVCSETPIESLEDFMNRVKNGEMKVFSENL